MISVKNIHKHFDNQYALKDVSADFEKGKCNLIIGESGSGKTVLLKTIVGLVCADKGEVLYDDVEFTRMRRNEKQKLRQEMGMLFQGGALFDSLNIEDNVLFPLTMFSSMSKKERLNRVNFCLECVRLENVNHMAPSELSGGMRKRAAIARAIVLSPKYLFCDEPNSGLDPKTSILIDELIKEITHEFNITTIVNSHDMNSVLEIGEKVIYMYNGEKCWEGTNKEVLHTDNKELNDFVFATKVAQQIKV
jgi:phospholipid/cholesterol/gamma-HCH transport system ATP-binding protein